MSFLLGFITKERQNEMLVDKLCHRFPKCTTIEQKADIAFCMSQLKVNERSVKTLVDNFKLYKDALFDEDVKRHFVSIISKAKKFAKPEMKQALEEFERNIDEQSALGVDNQRTGDKAVLAKKRASQRGTRKAKRMETLQEWEEEDYTELDDGNDDGTGEQEEKENFKNSQEMMVEEESTSLGKRKTTRRTRNASAILR
jgi:condensin complex subunit 1